MTLNIYKYVGIRLKIFRNLYGKTQNEVALELDISQAALVNYEKGIKKIPLDKLISFAQYYNVGLNDLVGFDNIDNHNQYSTYEKQLVEQHALWFSELGSTRFERDEVMELIAYSKYLIYKRKIT